MSAPLSEPVLGMLGKFAGTRARDASFEVVAPVITTPGWSMPDGDTLLCVNAGDDLAPMYVRVREVAMTDSDALVTAALTDDTAAVQDMDGELVISGAIECAECREGVSPVEAAHRAAIATVAPRPIFDALVAMQV